MTDPEALRRLEAVVAGRVHGVGFRLFALGAARALGLDGWVANEPGGRVRVVAEGAEPQLRRLLEQLHAGPPAAVVEHVSEDWSQASGGFHGFEIRSGFHGGD